MSASRKTVRTALATLLQTALVGTGKPAQAVYAYRVGDFGGQFPVVCLGASGASHSAMTLQGGRAVFGIDVYVFVLYSDGSAWTETQAENALDDIEQIIADTVNANRSGASWRALSFNGESEIDITVIGGKDYWREVIPIKVEVFA